MASQGCATGYSPGTGAEARFTPPGDCQKLPSLSHGVVTIFSPRLHCPMSFNVHLLGTSWTHGQVHPTHCTPHIALLPSCRSLLPCHLHTVMSQSLAQRRASIWLVQLLPSSSVAPLLCFSFLYGFVTGGPITHCADVAICSSEHQLQEVWNLEGWLPALSPVPRTVRGIE